MTPLMVIASEEQARRRRIAGKEKEPSSEESRLRLLRMELQSSDSGPWTRTENWNLISAGPSMMQVKPEDLLKDSLTVAINRALTVRNRVPVDIWAVWDDPQRLFELGYDRHVYHPLTIWLGPNRFQQFFLAAMGKIESPLWEEYLDPRVGLRAMPWGYHSTEGRDLEGKECLVAKTVFTLIFAIEKAVSLGAKHIRIFGADMTGSWAPGMTEEECMEKWGDRWSWERQKLKECMDAADEIEVFIECL